VRRFALALALLSVSSLARAQDTRPNVVIFLADDLGVGDLGAYGQTRIATPNIDRLATEGVIARHAYSAAPVCAPSRCALMTGMHTGHCSVDHNEEPNIPLGLSDPTLPEVLAREGYRTALIGKWGLGGETDEGAAYGTASLPTAMGFSHVFAVLDQERAQNHFPERVFVDGSWRELPGNAGGRRILFDEDLFFGDALTFVSATETDPRPFFLVFASTLPHRTFDPPSIAHTEDWPDVERAYATMVERFDRDVGTIVSQLDAVSGDRRTIVIIASDNGPTSVDGHEVSFFGSSMTLRGQKRDLYDGGLRVPLIVRWRGTLDARELTVPVALYDLFPTITDLVHTTSPAGMDGVSLAPWLRGERSDAPHASMFFSALEGRGGSEPRTLFSFHEGPLALIERADGIAELYDLDADPSQANDLASARASEVTRLHDARVAAGTGPITRATPVLHASLDGAPLVIDLGSVVLHGAEITRTIEITNAATAPARAMDVSFDTTAVTDPRLSIEARPTTSVTPDAAPVVLTIRFVPSTAGALADQRVVVQAIIRHTEDAATGSPLTIEIRGDATAPSEPLPILPIVIVVVVALAIAAMLLRRQRQ
jgi:arylsulfatase A-like enzyme